MPDRFYVPGEWSDRVELPETEAHHLARVLRAVQGDTIEIFDGLGNSALAEVESLPKHGAVVRLISPVKSTPEPTCQITLAVAVPKGDRWRWLVEKVTEMGVDRLIPLSTSRSVVKPGDQKLHKAEQTVIAACKQCGRDRLLQIDNLCPLHELNQRINLNRGRMWIGSADDTYSASHGLHDRFCIDPMYAVIGPEGGFTAQELLLLENWKGIPLSLSPFTLRIETAALAFAAWLCTERFPAHEEEF